MPTTPRKICFVTGTRAEFGLMRSALEAIRAHPALDLQLVVTGMHLHRAHGRSIDEVRRQGWEIDAVVKWPLTGHAPADVARQTGRATADLADVFERLGSDVVLVVGDRVEAFAAAAAAHVSRRVVAHVHGGDRALGQVDDSLRHAITKLAHVHFPATRQSAGRLLKLGEDRWRVHRVGSPGVDGITSAAAPREALAQRFPDLKRGQFALVALHPVDGSADVEHARAATVLKAVRAAGVPQVVVVHPNNDPGSAGIIRCWRERRGDITHGLPDVPRHLFLALMRDAALMVGNSSAGLIEAGSFRTPVVDVGDRQAGRERGANVTHVTYAPAAVERAVAGIWNGGNPRRAAAGNVYGGGNAGRRIAAALASLPGADRLTRKLIAY